MKPSRARAVRVLKAEHVLFKTKGMSATRSPRATNNSAVQSACLESRTRAEILATLQLALSSLALQFHPLHPLRQVHLLPYQPLLPRLPVRLPPVRLHTTPFAPVYSALQLKAPAQTIALSMKIACFSRTRLATDRIAFHCPALVQTNALLTQIVLFRLPRRRHPHRRPVRPRLQLPRRPQVLLRLVAVLLRQVLLLPQLHLHQAVALHLRPVLRLVVVLLRRVLLRPAAVHPRQLLLRLRLPTRFALTHNAFPFQVPARVIVLQTRIAFRNRTLPVLAKRAFR